MEGGIETGHLGLIDDDNDDNVDDDDYDDTHDTEGYSKFLGQTKLPISKFRIVWRI